MVSQEKGRMSVGHILLSVLLAELSYNICVLKGLVAIIEFTVISTV